MKRKEIMKIRKQLAQQLRQVQNLLTQLDEATPDDQGNYGQFSDLNAKIEGFLIEELDLKVIAVHVKES